MRKRPIAGRYLCSNDVCQHVPNPRQALQAESKRNPAVLKKPLEDTDGFMGSPTLVSQSSILLVCSLIVSSGLGSFVASALPWGAN